MGMSDSTTASDDPKFLRPLCHVCWSVSLGAPRGQDCPPLVAHNIWGSARNLFLAVFAILAYFGHVRFLLSKDC
jgi:hypothetical protein